MTGALTGIQRALKKVCPKPCFEASVKRALRLTYYWRDADTAAFFSKTPRFSSGDKNAGQTLPLRNQSGKDMVKQMTISSQQKKGTTLQHSLSKSLQCTQITQRGLFFFFPQQKWNYILSPLALPLNITWAWNSKQKWLILSVTLHNHFYIVPWVRVKLKVTQMGLGFFRMANGGRLVNTFVEPPTLLWTQKHSVLCTSNFMAVKFLLVVVRNVNKSSNLSTPFANSAEETLGV